MIASLLLALQVVVGPATLTVRGPGSETVVPVVETRAGRAIAVEMLAPVIPVSVRGDTTGRYAISFAGVDFSVTVQSPFLRIAGVVVPLASPPFVSGGRLYLPMQVVTEILPRRAPSRLRYDASRAELRYTSPSSGRVATADAAPTGSAGRAAPSPPRRSSAPANGATRLARGHRVVVDAGHGGPDRGMSGPIGTKWKIYEKDITLAVAGRVETALRARGVEVVMTRRTDTLIALSDRGKIANREQGDLFLSIHVNAANLRWKRPQDARGFETYFLAEAKTEDDRRVERMENESIRFETDAEATRDDPLNFIIHDMAQNEHLRESSELAAVVQDRLRDMHPGPNRGVKQAGFRVLVTAFMPAVLIEIGFGTNAAEARFLNDAAHQTRIAAAIADATVEYLGRYDKRVGGTR